MLSCGFIHDEDGKLVPFEVKTLAHINPEQAIRDAAMDYAKTPLGELMLKRYGRITAALFLENPPPHEFLARFGIRRLRTMPIRAHFDSHDVLVSDEDAAAGTMSASENDSISKDGERYSE